MGLFDRPIKAGPDGSLIVKLGDDEREILGRIAAELAQMLDAVDGGVDGDHPLGRLFPAAHVDPDEDAEWRRLMSDDLAQRHREAVSTLIDHADAGVVPADQIDGWVRALNLARLTLGSAIGVTEDETDVAPDHPEAPRYALYHWLSYLLELTMSALD